MPSSSHNMSFWENQLSKHKQREFWRRLLFAEMRIPQFWPNNEMPFFPTIPSEFTFAESSPIICLYEYKKMNDEIFFIFCYYKCCVSNIQFIFLKHFWLILDAHVCFFNLYLYFPLSSRMQCYSISRYHCEVTTREERDFKSIFISDHK